MKAITYFRKYTKEIIIFVIQLLVFYLIPPFALPVGAMGMVLLIMLLTFLLSSLLGAFSKNKLKFLYPVFVAVVFIPSVFIYYNESAFVHALWYFVVSFVGLILGAGFRKIIK